MDLSGFSVYHQVMVDSYCVKIGHCRDRLNLVPIHSQMLTNGVEMSLPFT
jgi:hypothetical protein